MLLAADLQLDVLTGLSIPPFVGDVKELHARARAGLRAGP